MTTEIYLDCPTDPNVRFKLQAVSNGVQIVKEHTNVSSITETIDVSETVETITTTITRTIGESITF